MIVVADSSPLHYLILIDQIDLLPILYSKVLVPTAVVKELQAPQCPAPVQAWMAQTPAWLEIAPPTASSTDALSFLGAGEREAIVLAEQLHADALLIDDRDARKEADARNLVTIGTLGVLVDGAERGLIELAEVIARLRQTSFRASPQLLKSILDRYYDAT